MSASFFTPLLHSLTELQRRQLQLEQRLDRLYDDKLDEKISEEHYNRKFQQYASEKETVVEHLQRYSQASTKYYELGIDIYNLA